MPDQYRASQFFDIGNKLLSYGTDDIDTEGGVVITGQGTVLYGQLLSLVTATGKYRKYAALDATTNLSTITNFAIAFNTEPMSAAVEDISIAVLTEGAVNAQGIIGFPANGAEQNALRNILRNAGIYVHFVVPALG